MAVAGDGESGEAGAGAGLSGVPLAAFEFRCAGRDWRVRAVRNQDALLAAAERFDQFPFGLLLWESAPVLAGVLAERPARVAGKRVLELGAGAGFAGIVAAALGGRVKQTDHAYEALELCRMNAAANGVAGIEVATGDWNAWREEGRYDVILGSDVLYDRDVFKPLMAILERNLATSGRVLFTDPGRGDTPQFLAVMRLAGWHVETQRVVTPALVPANGRESVAIDVIEMRRTKL